MFRGEACWQCMLIAPIWTVKHDFSIEYSMPNCFDVGLMSDYMYCTSLR